MKEQLSRQLHDSADSAFSAACFDLVNYGSTVVVATSEQGDKATTELLNYTVVFAPWHNPFIVNHIRRFPSKGACAEFLWYMTADNRVEAVVPYLKNWARFADDNGRVNSNYGCYWRDGVRWCLEELRRDKASRRAVLNIYAHGNRPFGKDTPCTLSLQFLIRDDKLHLIANMRSNDIWYGFSIDQFCNSMLHRLVYNELCKNYADLQLGNYYHNAASFHAYDNTAPVDKLNDCIKWFARNVDSIDNTDAKMLEGVTFDNFWTEAEKYFEPAMFAYFKQRAIDNNCVNLVNF